MFVVDMIPEGVFLSRAEAEGFWLFEDYVVVAERFFDRRVYASLFFEVDDKSKGCPAACAGSAK